MELLLIGEDGSKRTDYMKKAAQSQGAALRFLSWQQLRHTQDMDMLKGRLVKIDPPAFSAVRLQEMQERLLEYRRLLQRLEQAQCRFLNTPGVLGLLLDKRGTKRRLQEKGIPSTQMFFEEVRSTGQLLELMQERHCPAVFVKPRYFSGAAGVAALRIHPGLGKMVLYTSCRMEGGGLINSKKLFRMEERREIAALLDRLLLLDCVIERWHPKADVEGRSYDLRVVFQFGHIAYMVARRSKGPITNLHLNNQALDVQALHLEPRVYEELQEVCSRALQEFPGLSMAGMDILLEKGTLRPRLIEMNGQGDLIYQDIYGENQIYREQVRDACRKLI